ncbi:MAG: hydrogenase maturation peptidase HycI [Methanobrevibacter sp.]|nr:hydrogenase maturation peptidase HycI [Methanobrevibacter sp.]MEE1337234.1 hydrogenase maturation peptidase HycI [Methanobrevibacter sp.]
MGFESQLNNFLIDCEKLIVLGVGNELKSDDGVGPFIIKRLKEENVENSNLLFIDAGTVPENFTGKIRKENPTHLIIVDACLMDSNPGDMKIVDKDEFANIGISTHSMSLSFFVRYLEKDTEIRIIFVGIEPETMDWGVKPTPNVEKSADEFIETLKGIIV